MKHLTIIQILLFSPLLLAAQATKSVTENLSRTNQENGARITVAEKGSAQSLVRSLDNPSAAATVKGYRVCIFMDKNQSARENAFAAEAKFKEMYPDIATYVFYDKSSYWKVLAGNCLTIEEVTILKGKAEKLFPGKPFIVKEDIPVSEFGRKGAQRASTEFLGNEAMQSDGSTTPVIQ